MSSRNRWINRLAKRSVLASAAAAATSTLLGTSAWAVTGTWITTSSAVYSTPGAWQFGNIPGAAQDIASFTAVDLSPGYATNPNSVQQLTVDLTSQMLTLGQLVFADTNTATPGSWKILSTSGTGTLVLNNGAGSTPIINVGALGILTPSGLSGFAQIDVPIINLQTGVGAGLIKSGAGELRMTRSNDFGGGTLFVNQGTLVVGNLNQIANVSSSITLGGGTLALRADGAFNLSNAQLNIGSVTSGNSGLYLDNAIGSSLTGQNVVDQIGTVAFTTAGVRLSVGGNTNGYGLHIGLLNFQQGGSSFFTDLNSSLVTIDNVTSGATGTLTFTGVDGASGSNLTITGSISQTGAGSLSVNYSDSHTLSVGSFGTPAPTGALTVSGSGTLLITGSNAVIPSATLTVNDGTLDFSNSSLQSVVGTLLMGGAGNSASFIKMGSGGLQLTGNAIFTAGSSTNPSQPGVITGATGGKFSLSSTATATQTFTINQILTTTGVVGQDLTINVPTVVTGTMVKVGNGELVLAGANTVGGTINVAGGTLTSIARTSGSALTTNTASGTVVISSGNLRILNNTASSGSAAAGSLYFTGDLKPAQLIIDASTGGGQATLNIGTLGGRLSGSGVLTIIPVSNTLNTVEHINVVGYGSAVDPVNNHGILAPFIATQQNATNSALDFVARVGGAGAGSNNLVAPTYTTFLGTESGSSAVVVRNTDFVDNSFGSVFAIKIGNGANVSGGGFLQLGDSNRAGAILNDGAQINISNLLLTSAESVFWSGGTTTGGTVGSVINLNNSGANNLTTGGAQTLTFSNTINLGTNSRTITVGSGTTLFSGNMIQGNLAKSGPGVLLLTGDNPSFNGTLTVAQGTVSVGTGGAGSLGTGSVDTGNTATGTGTLQFNLSGSRTISNFMTGAGTILQNSSTGGLLVLHSTPASTYSNLAILNGAVQLSANNDIPVAGTIAVGGGSLDLHGFNQTINALAGGIARDSNNTIISTGLITNSTSILSILTLNPTVGGVTTNATYSGNIGGTSFVRIVKTGSGTQTLAGNGDYTGGVTMNSGTLSAASNTALGHDASVILNNANGGVLRLESNGPTIPASVSFSIGNGTGTVSVGSFNGNANAGTILGSIVGQGTFVINNQSNGSQLTIAGNSLDGMVDTVTGSVGTVLMSSGGIRFTAAAGANVGNTSVNFNLSGTGVISTVNAATLRMGNITGGGNTTISPANGSVVQLGAAGGAQQFNGTISGTNVVFSKVGIGTLQINNKTESYTGATNILGGTLLLSSAILSGTPTINIVSGPLLMTGAASITSTAAINLSEAFAFDVSSHQGWSTPANLTVQGTGLVSGKYAHNGGTFLPGTDGGFGSITFNTFDTRNTLTFGDLNVSAPGSAGVTLLDFSSLGVVGSGNNDLITVWGDVAFNTDALFRVNNINPTHNFTAGETYPAILYSGSELTGLASAVSSAFRGSFQLVNMPDPTATNPGFHLVGVKVVSFNTAPSISTWQGSVSSTWDLNITKNFTNAAEGTTTFYQGDSVVFDNSVLGSPPTPGNKSINLSNGLLLPGTLTFGNTSNLLSYTVNGPGIIGGGARVLVNGGGTVSFTNANNTFTGGTVINSGWLMVSGGGNLNQSGAMGVGSILINGGSTGQSGTLVFAANANPNNDIYVPSGQMANFVGLGSLGTGGKLNGTINLISTGGNRWDLYTNLQLPTDPSTGTILINSPSTIRLMRPYAGAGLFFNFAAGAGAVTTNLFDPMNDSVYLGGIAGPGSGNIFGFTGGNPAWYKAFVIGGANADSTWGGQVTDSFGRAPATGGGANGAGVLNTHGPTAIIKAGTASLKLNGVSILMSGDLTVNSGTMIVDNTDQFLGTRDGGGLFVWASRVVVNSGATFQIGSGGADGLGNYMGDNQSNAGTFLQAGTTGYGVSWNANNGTINLSKGYNSTPASYSTNNLGSTNPENLFTAFNVDPNLTISGSNSKIYGNVRLAGGTLSPGSGGTGRFGAMTIVGAGVYDMQNPGDTLDDATSQSDALTMAGGALVFDVGSTTTSADTITVVGNGVGTNAGNGQLRINNVPSNQIVVNFNGNSIASGQTYTLMGFSSLSGGTFQGATGPKLVLNGRNAAGTLIANNPITPTKMILSITTAASASNLQWASANGTWDVASWGAGATKNWANLDTSSTPDYFYQGDNINFDSSLISGTVNVGGSVAPAVMTVNTGSATSITFAGNGRITGNASVVKNGNGTMSIRTQNDYSGGTTINAGTLEMGTSPGASYANAFANLQTTGPFFDSDRTGDVGTGTVTIMPGATLAYRSTRGGHLTNNIVGGGNFVVDVLAGAIRLDTAGSWTGGTTVRVGYLSLGVDNGVPSTGSLNILTIPHPTIAPGAQATLTGAGGRFDLNEHSQSINELYGNGSYSLVMNEGSLNISNPQTTFSVGSGNFVGAVHQGQEGGGQGTFAQIAIVKFSTGTLTMNYVTTPNSNGGTLGTNVTGLTDVKQGVMVMRGIQAANGANDATNTQSGSWTVRNGASLDGDGTIRSTVNVDPGGILAPGLPDPTVHTGGTLTMNALSLNNATLNFDLRGIDNDDIDVQINNQLNVLGLSTINVNADNTLVTQPGTYKLLDYRGTALQNFAGKFTLGSVTNPGIFSFALQHNTALTEVDLIVTQPTVTSTWNISTGGTWAIGSNWASVGTLTLAPNSVDSVANLTAPASMSVDPTIIVNNTIALATLNLATANGHSFTLKPVSIGALNFNTSGANAVGINVISGNHIINTPTQFNQDPTISVAASSTLTLLQSLDAAGQNVTKTGAGVLKIGNIRSTSGFDGSANFRIAAGTVQIANFAPANLVNGASKVNTLTIDSTGTLDITNNAIVMDYAGAGNGTSLLSSTRSLITSHRIVSSDLGTATFDPSGTHAIGYRDNQGTSLSSRDPSPSTGSYRSLGSVADQGGAGVSTDPTSIIVKYTYKGDTNLDGAVDINDLLNVATHYNQHTGAGVIAGVGGDGWVWQQGDFNNDGNVDITDLQYVGTNWLLGTGSNPGTQLSPLLTALGLPTVPSGGAAVPEPATLGIVGIGLTGLMARRRRRRS